MDPLLQAVHVITGATGDMGEQMQAMLSRRQPCVTTGGCRPGRACAARQCGAHLHLPGSSSTHDWVLTMLADRPTPPCFPLSAEMAIQTSPLALVPTNVLQAFTQRRSSSDGIHPPPQVRPCSRCCWSVSLHAKPAGCLRPSCCIWHTTPV